MSGYTAYLELPSGERIELPATMPDITEADSPLWDGKFELPEAVKETLLPYGTVIYIEDVGIRIVQDRGNAVQGNHLDVAVSGSHEDALNWDGYGEHQVWIIKEAG